MSTILEMRGVCKRFGDVLANDHIDLQVEAGSVHSIVGENGAGKTTLMNILYGLYNADSGEIRVRGEPVRINSPLDAIRLGIGMIHQHFKLVLNMTVADNVMMAMEPVRWGFLLDRRRMREETRAISDRYGLQVDPDATVSDISVGLRQRVEILKALYRKVDLLILDEPTALLTPQEVVELFEVIGRLRADGKTILFISHKLKEVMEISDRVTALRNGKVVGTVEKKDTSEVELAQMMVGRDVFLKPAPPPKAIGEPILRVEGLNAVNNYGVPVLRNVSFEVRAGEILGIAGVDGNGQSELVRALLGLQPVRSGRILIGGQDLTNASTSASRQAGIGAIPEDRLGEGLISDFQVDENLILGVHGQPPLSQRGLLNLGQIAENSKRLIQQYDIRPPDRKMYAKLLSGGNQQKIIVAREISRAPQLLVAAQPTRGLDIAATDFIHEQLIRQRDAGKAILLVSLFLEEILLLSNRIAVMYHGEIVGLLQREAATAEQIGRMMLGIERQADLMDAGQKGMSDALA